MHDTSTQSNSRWKTVGAKRNDSAILGPSQISEVRRQSRKYRPSKQKEISNAKIFNRNKSRMESLDNIPKEDLNDSHVKDTSVMRSRRTQNSQEINAPIVRVNSESTFLQNKDLSVIQAIKPKRKSSFANEKQLIALKEDYNRFKQKILTELEIQKQNISKMVNEILQSVRSQLLQIEQKYAKNMNGKGSQSLPVFPVINLPQFNAPLSKMKLADISVINTVTQSQTPMNATEKAIINELKQLNSVDDDPITQRFSKFYSAIQKLKSDLDCLHEISTPVGDGQGVSGMKSLIDGAKQKGQTSGFSPVLKV